MASSTGAPLPSKELKENSAQSFYFDQRGKSIGSKPSTRVKGSTESAQHVYLQGSDENLRRSMQAELNRKPFG